LKQAMIALPHNPTRLAFRALNRIMRPFVKRGAFSPPAIGGGLVVLETTGRTSRLPREVPLVATRLGDRVVVSTVRADSQWMRNLEAEPSAGVWIRGERRAATAQVRRGALNLVHLALGEPESLASPAAA
jgi:deazaflavin-dependent oxidoreductase (nitroreductase family)